LIQVRALVFSSERHIRIILEDINGKRQSVGLSSLRGMDMVLHSPVVDRQRDDAACDF